MSDFPLQRPASAHDSSNNSALVTFSHADGGLLRSVPSLHPTPSQTGVNTWQLQYPITHPQGVPAVLELQETVQLVTKRAREALNDQHETARRALLHQQEEFLAATHQYEAAARQNLVSTLARNSEAHNCNVQIQVKQLNMKQMRDLLRNRGNCYLDFLRKQITLLKINENFGDGSDFRSMETRRASS